MLKGVDRLEKVKRMRVADKDIQGLKTPYEVRQQQQLFACFRCEYAKVCHSPTESAFSAEGRVCADGRLMDGPGSRQVAAPSNVCVAVILRRAIYDARCAAAHLGGTSSAQSFMTTFVSRSCRAFPGCCSWICQPSRYYNEGNTWAIHSLLWEKRIPELFAVSELEVQSDRGGG